MEESPSGAGSHKRTRPVEAAGAADAQTRPPRLGKHCAFSPSFHRALPHHKHTQRKTRKSTGHWASWSPFSQFRTHMNFRRAIKIIHNGIPDVRIQNTREHNLESIGLAPDHTGLLIGAVSHFRREKGVDITVRAFATVSDNYPDARLVLVGSGYQETELRALTARLGLAEKVIFAGFRTDAVEVLSLLDVYVLSSYEEGISITLLEASSLGKPSVVSDVGGNPEIVVQGENGLLVPSGSPGELAREISRMLEDSHFREKLGQNLRRTYLDKFSVQIMVDDTCAYFREVIHR